MESPAIWAVNAQENIACIQCADHLPLIAATRFVTVEKHAMIAMKIAAGARMMNLQL